MKFKLNPALLGLLLALLAYTLFPPISVMAQTGCNGQIALAPDGSGGYISGYVNAGDPGTVCSLATTGRQVTINGTLHDEYAYTVTKGGQTGTYTVYMPAAPATAPTAEVATVTDNLNPQRSNLLDVEVNRPSIGLFYNPDPSCTTGYRCFWMKLSVVPIAGVLVLSILTNILSVIFHKLDKYSERRNTVYAFLGGIGGAVLLTLFEYFNLPIAFRAVALVVVLIALGNLYMNRFDGLTTETGNEFEVSLWKVWSAYQKSHDAVYKSDDFVGKPSDPTKEGFLKDIDAFSAMTAILNIKQRDDDGKDTKKPLFAGSASSIKRHGGTKFHDGILLYQKTKPGIDLTMMLIILSVLLTGAIIVWGINIFTAIYGSILTWLWLREYGREITTAKKFTTNIRRVAGVVLIMVASLLLIGHPIIAFAAAMATAALLHQDWLKEGGFDLGNGVSALVVSVTMWLILFFGPQASFFFNGSNPLFNLIF